MGFKKSILACAALSVCLAMVAAGDDWANFGRYEAQNAEVLQLPAKERNVVFLGNSITENWARIHPEFFQKTRLCAARHQRSDFLSIPAPFP